MFKIEYLFAQWSSAIRLSKIEFALFITVSKHLLWRVKDMSDIASSFCSSGHSTCDVYEFAFGFKWSDKIVFLIWCQNLNGWCDVFIFVVTVTGTLKGYDQLLNLVLDEAVEFLRGNHCYVILVIIFFPHMVLWCASTCACTLVVLCKSEIVVSWLWFHFDSL